MGQRRGGRGFRGALGRVRANLQFCRTGGELEGPRTLRRECGRGAAQRRRRRSGPGRGAARAGSGRRASRAQRRARPRRRATAGARRGARGAEPCEPGARAGDGHVQIMPAVRQGARAGGATHHSSAFSKEVSVQDTSGLDALRRDSAKTSTTRPTSTDVMQRTELAPGRRECAQRSQSVSHRASGTLKRQQLNCKINTVLSF